MNRPPSPFRYFCDPRHFSSYRDAGEVCPFCGLVRPGYGGESFGAAEWGEYDQHYNFICEVCLGDGKLVKKDLPLHRELLEEGKELRSDLRLRYPKMSRAEVETLAQERTIELVHCTPKIKGLSAYYWASHCGNFCCFIKEAGQLDMHWLAPNGNGHAFLESLLDADIWDMLRPDAPVDNSVEHHVGLYLFQCLECGKYRVGYRLG